jgi:hypothetical protein
MAQRKSAENDTEMEPRTWGTRQERERCDALAQHVGRVAARHKAVRDARTALFGSELATAENAQRAHELLESPATRNLGPKDFLKHEIPFGSHRTDWAKSKAGEIPECDDSADWRKVTGLRLLWPGGSIVVPPFRVVISNTRGTQPGRVRLPSRRGGAWATVAPHGTWLALIARYTARIARDLLWSEENAAWFLLTGEIPKIEPVTAHIVEATDDHGRSLRPEIVLRAQPFVSIGSLDRAISACRLELGRRLRLGPPLASRTLAVFEFVEEQRAQSAWEVVPWTRLMRRWDATERARKRKWGYGDRGNFRRDYERIRELLLEEYTTPLSHQEAWLASQRASGDA